MSNSPKSPGPAPAMPKDPKVEVAHQEGFNLGYAQGAERALQLINRVLDQTELSRLGDGEVRSVGPAYSQELFKEAEAKIRKLQNR